MQLYRIKKTGQIGFFPSSSRTSYDMSTEPITVYKFLRLVDPSTDWENVKLGRDMIFTGEADRYNLNDLQPVYLQDLKKAAKSSKDKKKVNEAAEMAKSDLHKIVDYSEKLQSMINPSENTEDWVKAKLTHAADYLDTVFDYLRFYYEKGREIDESYNAPRKGMKKRWSIKRKRKISCSNPKGFSQINYCKRKSRGGGYKNESVLPIVGTHIKPGGHIYRGLSPKIEDELNGAIQRIVNHNHTDQDLQLIKFYLKKILTDNAELRNIDLNKPAGYFPNKSPVLDLIHGVVSGIPPKDIKYFIEDLKGSAENLKDPSKLNTKLGYVSVDESKTINEFYQMTGQILFESQDSEMLLGDLKNINAKAKMLMKIIDDSENLEDWVKSKLNLAGEYLDDVFHHIDYFGQQGRKFDTEQITKQLEEGWKDWLAAAAIGASTLGGVSGLEAKPIKVSKQLVPVKKPAITQTVSVNKPTTSDVSIDQSFIDYIKAAENAGKKGYDKQKKLWFPHKSFEGGSDTIAYGHKIQPGENFSKGITDAQAEALLKKDLEKARDQVTKELGGRQLSKKQMEMFVDFVFNMGTLKKFPKFTVAALKNDKEGMKSQYKRFAGGKELKGRNSAFLQRFLNEYFGFNYFF